MYSRIVYLYKKHIDISVSVKYGNKGNICKVWYNFILLQNINISSQYILSIKGIKLFVMAALYLFPALLADVDYKECLPEGNIQKILSCECFIVEELRTARRLLRKIGYKKSFDEVTFFVLNEHTTDEELKDCLLPVK